MNKTGRSDLFILCLLGALCVLTPFAIDLYLPSFTQIAQDMGTTSATVSLSLSSYFIGLAGGQLFYGPLLDRFGRKRPIYFGLGIFCIGAIGCMLTKNVETLIALRLLQGLGGCAAQVGAIAMVRDFFAPEKAAKIFSLLFLFIGASPLLAPTIGSLIAQYFGWQFVFVFMFALAGSILALIAFLLPEGHAPDPTISLKPADIFKTFLKILENRTFLTYAVAGGFCFAGLFANVAGAPIIFMDQFGLSPRGFGLVFPVMAGGFIGGSQINVFLLKFFTSEQIFTWALRLQVLCGLVFLLGTMAGLGLVGTLVLLVLFLACTGIANPNASALALSPFTHNAGSASALLGILQMGLGALVSMSVGILKAKSALPIIVILFATALIALILHTLLRPRQIITPEAGL